MSDFAEWRPCRVCGLPVALPKRVHDECAEKETQERTVEKATVRLEWLSMLNRAAIELREIDAESRLDRNERCVLGCRGQWQYDDDGDHEPHFIHAEFCPFTLADKAERH